MHVHHHVGGLSKTLAGGTLIGLTAIAVAQTGSQTFLIRGAPRSCSDITLLDSALTSGNQQFFAGWSGSDYADAIAWSQACAPYGWHIPGQPRLPLLLSQRDRALAAPAASAPAIPAPGAPPSASLGPSAQAAFNSSAIAASTLSGAGGAVTPQAVAGAAPSAPPDPGAGSAAPPNAELTQQGTWTYRSGMWTYSAPPAAPQSAPVAPSAPVPQNAPVAPTAPIAMSAPAMASAPVGSASPLGSTAVAAGAASTAPSDSPAGAAAGAGVGAGAPIVAAAAPAAPAASVLVASAPVTSAPVTSPAAPAVVAAAGDPAAVSASTQGAAVVLPSPGSMPVPAVMPATAAVGSTASMKAEAAPPAMPVSMAIPLASAPSEPAVAISGGVASPVIAPVATNARAGERAPEGDEESLLTDSYVKQHFHRESIWVASRAHLDVGTDAPVTSSQMKNRITADKVVLYCARKANSGESGSSHPLLWDWRWCEAEEAAAYNRLVSGNEFPNAGRAVLLGCAGLESYVYFERCMQTLSDAGGSASAPRTQ